MKLKEYLNQQLPSVLTALEKSEFEFMVADLYEDQVYIYVQFNLEKKGSLNDFLHKSGFYQLKEREDYRESFYRHKNGKYYVDVVYDADLFTKHIELLRHKHREFTSNQISLLLSLMYSASKSD